MDTIFMNTENSKTNEPYKFVVNLQRRLGLNKTFQKLSIYYTWKNIRQQYKNNKIKIIAPTWNGEFELLDGSYSVSKVQGYIEYIIKRMKY